MSDDNNIKTVFDIDTKEGIEHVLDLKGHIESLGDAKNVEGLLEGLSKIGGAIAAVGVAAFALKTAFDSVFEAENIKQINNQFELLTKNSGLAGQALKEGLIEAAHGLVGETDLLQAANRAIVEMGTSAEKLPELMEIARKSTAVFGGDALTRFEDLSHAIAAGSQKALKHMGIMVDVDKAYKAYAASIGIATSELTEAGKRQAVLNAVLDKGEDAFDGVDESVKQATNAWKQLGIIITEIKETFVIAFDKVMGPSVKSFLEMTKNAATNMKLFFQDKLGEGAVAAEAHMQRVQNSIKELEDKLKQLDTTGQTFFNGQYVSKGTQAGDAAIQAMRSKLEGLRGDLASTNKQIEQTQKNAEGSGGVGSTGAEDQVDKQKKLANEAKFESEMLKLQEDRVRESMRMTKSLSEYQDLADKEKELKADETAAKIKALQQSEHLNNQQKNEMIAAENAALQQQIMSMDLATFEHKRQMMQNQIGLMDNLDQYEQLKEQEKQNLKQQYELQQQQLAQNKDITDEARAQAKLELERNYQMQLYQIQDQAEHEREQITNRWVLHGDNAAEKWARGFASGSMKAQKSLRDFGAQGEKVFDIMTTHMGNAFMELGEGAKKGSEVMKSAMLGMIADIAQYYGQMALAAGLVPPNPVYLAAGAALLTLAGYLRGQAKGGSSSSGGGVGGGSVSGIGDLGGAPSSLAQSNLMDQQQKQTKMVHLEIHGSVFDSNATATRIAELVRQSEDATDFGITRVGGGV